MFKALIYHKASRRPKSGLHAPSLPGIREWAARTGNAERGTQSYQYPTAPTCHSLSGPFIFLFLMENGQQRGAWRGLTDMARRPRTHKRGLSSRVSLHALLFYQPTYIYNTFTQAVRQPQTYTTHLSDMSYTLNIYYTLKRLRCGVRCRHAFIIGNRSSRR